MRTLEEQRIEYSNRKFLAMPIAGLLIWSLVGFSGLFLGEQIAIGTIIIGTASIVFLGMFISKFTGEDFFNKSKPKNTFDNLYLLFIGMSLLVYAIAIPFFIIDYSSLPLSVGILSGLMWFPFSWIIKHWIGIFHSVLRTCSIVLLWYLFPKNRFTIIPFTIAIIYIISIIILHTRKRAKKNE